MTFGGFGTSAGNVDGLNIINLGFLDGSGKAAAVPGSASTAMAAWLVGNTWGAVRLIDVTHVYIERLNAANFGVGYGVEAEGDPSIASAQTQVGTIISSTCSVCKIGVWGPQQTSDLLIQGGAYSGSAITGLVPLTGNQDLAYGADFESDALAAGVAGSVATGSVRVIGTAFRNQSGGAVKFFDCMGCQAVAIKGEQVKASSSPVGTGVLLDGTVGASPVKCANDVVVGGGFANYLTNVTVTSNCTAPTILTASVASFVFFLRGSVPDKRDGGAGTCGRGRGMQRHWDHGRGSCAVHGHPQEPVRASNKQRRNAHRVALRQRRAAHAHANLHLRNHFVHLVQ